MSRRLLVLLVLSLALIPSAAFADAVTVWNDEAIASIKATRTFAVPASRALAMVHLAIYDAVNGVDRRYQPYRFTDPAPAGASVEAAAAAAGYRVLAALFPSRQERLRALLASLLIAVPEGAAKSRGLAYGTAVAEAMLSWRAGDHADEQYAYVSQQLPGHWQPTPPAYGPPMYMQWEDVMPFAMTSGSQFRPDPPPALDSDTYVQAVNEIKALGGKHSTVRTLYQTETAFFWADSPGTITTAGRWNLVARQVAARHRYSLDQNARLFGLLNAALADAAIVAWDCKRETDFWRPVTAIRQASWVGDTRITEDPAWESLIPTPSFPEYVSGHATFSGAAATVLAREFGDQNDFAAATYQAPITVRTFHRFSDAAMEGAMSRVYGGIHYRFSSMAGLRLGRELGEYLYASFMTHNTSALTARRP